ncbi:MAG: nuclear transport factor 2 family protein [Pseudomonadota bacterium]
MAASLERYAAERACEKLVYRFLHLLESEHAKSVPLFTENAEAFNAVGRDKIQELFERIESVDHNINVLLSSNLWIEIVDDNHATASNDVTHYVASPEGQPELTTARTITRWSWEFRRVDGEWLIAKIAYPENLLLRKDVIELLEEQAQE